jgi:type III secretion protein R
MQVVDPVSLALILLTMSILPFVAMVVTSYTKIVVVLGLLRNALGVQQVPPNMVLNGIALIVSVYVFAPVGYEAAEAIKAHPVSSTGSSSSLVPQVFSYFDAGREPFRRFLSRHAHEREKAFFLKSAHTLWPKAQADAVKSDDLVILAPAFTLTELTEAFKIGFVLYLVFVVIDLVVANVLLAMGLSQVQPNNIAIPFKLLLFVMLDGWSLLIHGLILTYR